MKTTKALFGILTITMALAVQVQAQSFITNGLVAYYPFDGNANDKSGNGNNGTLHGAPQLVSDRLGNPNAAYNLNGTTDWIGAPKSPVLNLTNDLTIALWVKPRIAQHTIYWSLVSYSDSITDQYAIAFTSQNHIQFTYYTGVYHDTVDSSAAVWTNNVWQHVCVVVATSLKAVSFYQDGKLLSSISQSFTPPIPSVAQPQLYLGLNPGENYYFPGGIDDIRIYNRALSTNEVQQLYTYESQLIISLRKAVSPSFSNLYPGTNYQLQVSTDLSTWTNNGSQFTPTNSVMDYPQYFDVDNWNRLFFRLQVSP